MTDLFRHPTHPFDVDKVSRVQTDMTKADFPLHMSTYSCDLCGKVLWSEDIYRPRDSKPDTVLCGKCVKNDIVDLEYFPSTVPVVVIDNRRVKVTPHQPHSHTNNF